MAESTTAVSPCGSPAPSSSGGGAGTGTGTGAEGAAQGGLMGMFFPLIIFIAIFYFFIIRPQKKRDKQHNNMIAGINRGDQIVTIGGFLGTVREVRDDTFQIEIAEGVRVRILKSAVQTKRAAASNENQGATS